MGSANQREGRGTDRSVTTATSHGDDCESVGAEMRDDTINRAARKRKATDAAGHRVRRERWFDSYT